MRVNLPILQGVLPIQRKRIPLDIVAGITLAALAIPEVMGYAKIAQMPVVTGLYTLVLPVLIFGLLGSSRHLVVGADSATAAVMAAALTGMAAAGSSQYIALAGLLALMAGILLFVARVVKLGFIADFLSRTVLVGFLTGVGIQVACGQIAGMLGVTTDATRTLQKAWDAIKAIPDASLTTVAVSVSVIVVIKGSKYITNKIPGALIAVIGSIIVSYYAELDTHGVSTLGSVQSGLPKLTNPLSDITMSDVKALFPTALSILVLILAQSAATSRAYAAKYNDKFDENTDLVGLAGASLGAAFTGTFPVNGSPTKTQMVDGAGSKSQIAQMTTALVTIVVLLFLTGPLEYMPNAVLASVVFLIGLELVDIKGLKKILKVRPDEFWVAVITAATVVLVGVEQGIVLAILLSIIDHLRRSYNPTAGVVSFEGKHPHLVAGDTAARTKPGLVVFRFNASLYYANANRLLEDAEAFLNSTSPEPVKWLAFDLGGVDDVDFSAAETLKQVKESADERGAKIAFADIQDGVQKEFETFGLIELFGADAFHETIGDLVDAYESTNAG